MSGFLLAPVDDGGPSVALPPGETVIGRGALLGITDKKISRKHAILKVVDDQLSIRPVHVNPCFYWPIENDQLFPLETDKWHLLSPGDSVSLLEDKYIFKVVYTPLKEENLRKSDSLLDQIPTILQSTTMSHEEPSGQSTIAFSAHQVPEIHSLLKKGTKIPGKIHPTLSKKEESSPIQRKRQLPTWMLPADLMAPAPSSSVTKRGNNEEINQAPEKKQKMNKNEDSTFVREDNIRGMFPKDVPKNEERAIPPKADSAIELFNDQLQKEELGLSADRQACQSTETNKTNTSGKELEEVSSETEAKPSQSLLHQNEIQEPTLDQPIESQDVPQSSNINRPQRTACQYGRSCYRKNPTHFQQFSHPGDSDYLDTEALSQVDDEKPECPYGTSCYRKNPQHKLEYKHTTPPEIKRRKLRPKVTKKGDSDDDGEPNQYDLNDSFIDDEEEECDPTDEDSDWEPDFQDEDSEEVDTLLKEAKNFIKTKN